MNCRLLTAIVFLFLSAQVQGATLIGVVHVNRIDGPPVEHVQVTAAQGASPTESDSAGRFELIFPKKKPGEAVKLIVVKPGYAVVNTFVLELNLPSDPSANIVNVVIAKESEVSEKTADLFNLGSIKIAQNAYREGLLALREDNLAGREALRKDFERALKLIEESPLDWEKIVRAPNSDKFEEMLYLISIGKGEEALSVIKDEDLRFLFADAQRRKASAENDLEQLVQIYIVKAQVLSARFRFAESERAFREVIQGAPDNFDAQFAFAEFCEGLNRYPEAEVEYEKALSSARLTGDRAASAKTLSNLGLVRSRLHRLRSAKKTYRQALSIYRQLAREEPSTYSGGLANTLDRLGALLAREDRLDEARFFYAEALSISRKLVSEDRVTHLRLLELVLNSLAILDYRQMRFGEARQRFEEVFSIARELDEQDAQANLRDIAMVLNNLGLLTYKQNRLAQARLTLDEALLVYRELAQLNPEGYSHLLAIVSKNVGLVLVGQGKLDEAFCAFDDALRIHRALAKKYPNIYQGEVAEDLDNVGDLFRRQRRFDEARAALEEALNIRRGETGPESLFATTEILNDLGILLLEQGDFDGSLNFLRESLRVRRRLAQKHQEVYGAYVAESINNLGLLYLKLNRSADALQAFREALKIRRELARWQREAFSPSLAETLVNLGALFSRQRRNDDARKALEEAAMIYKELVNEEPQYVPQLELIGRMMPD